MYLRIYFCTFDFTQTFYVEDSTRKRFPVSGWSFDVGINFETTSNLLLSMWPMIKGSATFYRTLVALQT